MAQRSLNHEASDGAASGTGRQINPDGPVPCYSELILKEGSLLSDKTMADPSTSTTETSLDKSTICAKAERSTITVPAEVDLHQQIPSPLALYPSISQPIVPPPLSTPAPQPRQQTVNRCFSCRKRVGLLGFKCRCGDLFCATHRYSDKHDCSYDYRAAGRAAIAKQNPIVKAGKIEKI